jgi:hypothetical protein
MKLLTREGLSSILILFDWLGSDSWEQWGPNITPNSMHQLVQQGFKFLFGTQRFHMNLQKIYSIPITPTSKTTLCFTLQFSGFDMFPCICCPCENSRNHPRKFEPAIMSLQQKSAPYVHTILFLGDYRKHKSHLKHHTIHQWGCTHLVSNTNRYE